MATYEGIILTETTSLNLETKVFSAVKIPFMNDFGELETKVYSAEKMELFLIGDDNDLAKRKINRFNGHTTWGEDNSEPRRYPLENSWTKNNIYNF